MPQHTVFRFPTRTAFEDLASYQEDIPKPSSHEVLSKSEQSRLTRRIAKLQPHNIPSPSKTMLFQPPMQLVRSSILYGPAKHEVAGQVGGGVDGVMAQYIVRPAPAVVKVPAGSPQSFSESASLVYTGGVSMTALVLAKAAGTITIVTSSSDEKLHVVKEKFNPDFCINYTKTPDWASEAVKFTGGKGVDYILEIGGSGTIEQSLSAITRGGIIAIIGCMLEDLVAFVSRKKLRFQIDKVFGFSREDIVAAYNASASGKHIGKICIVLE
ncbi:Medium chain dehydrogenases/reductase MDR/zinc-dependent alcohol dehydrogenase-like family protein [Aspergillus parasiticus SU-1]|uniref:Medium chain dehydrogenases/reductase MDR/zinc-dependent alcohol dehydrogenase-like family protein n=1 Tax=Aspergillus parasiticus (strain ATCC 56775 / NRRL 5862 / SRRC 143 / SU-1) TaxID=1403190 RepID=A0A0F0HZG6_ASPPU|nr:Medium chain dehydrogenases/reductase MDR/zinc-dependent alcohol dehydrogenase-like family protein [Aspergillus parasiticus SU-1]